MGNVFDDCIAANIHRLLLPFERTSYLAFKTSGNFVPIQSTFNHMATELDNGIANFTRSRDSNPILDKLRDVSDGISPFIQIKSGCTVHSIVRTKGSKFFPALMAD